MSNNVDEMSNNVDETKVIDEASGVLYASAGRFAVKRHGRALLEEIMLCTQDLMRARIRREHDGLANAWNTFDFVGPPESRFRVFSEGNMPVMALFIRYAAGGQRNLDA